MKRALSHLLLLLCALTTSCTLMENWKQLPTSTPYAALFYQAYVRGFMAAAAAAECLYIFRTDVQAIYIPQEILFQEFGNYRYCVPARHWEFTPPLTTQVFAHIWQRDATLREVLGNTMGDVVRYPVSLSSNTPTGAIMGSPWESHMITLPDGKSLYCGQRAATAGQCSVR